jgi:uncharacterized protein YdaU (DUF1376 family)
MHYYQFNIGDYSSHTKHLSPTEDICYRRLLDYYYLHEQPIPNDLAKVTRLLCLNKEYIPDVEQVLNEFFMLSNDGWINERADKEIKQYQSFKTAGAAGAAKRWAKPDNSDGIGGLSGGIAKANAKQETLTIKHKPVKYIPPIPEELLSEWLAVRKKKPVTERVYNSVVKEANKLGWTPEQAIIKCCEKSWTGFEAAWITKDNKPTYQDAREAAARTAFGSLLINQNNIKVINHE